MIYEHVYTGKIHSIIWPDDDGLPTMRMTIVNKTTGIVTPTEIVMTKEDLTSGEGLADVCHSAFRRAVLALPEQVAIREEAAQSLRVTV